MISELSKPEIQKFIQDHLYDDPAALMLQAGKYPDLPMKQIVEQIKSKRKAKLKLPTYFTTEGVVYPAPLSMEQCSSERTAKYKASLVHGLSMTDLTGGFGVDSFYLGSGFQEAHYVERSDELVRLASHNFEQLGADHIQCHQGDGLIFLKEQEKPLMLAYLDPARRDEANQKVVSFSDCEPDVIANLPLLREKAVTVMIKASPMMDIKLGIRELGGVSEVHVVADHNEVKELLFIKSEKPVDNPSIICINLVKGDEMPYAFDYETEKGIEPEHGALAAYLYEPNAAILKAGAFKSVGAGHGLKKLHGNTHLYTSNELQGHFPGRIFRVKAMISMNKKALRKSIPDMKANVSVRNYPMTVSQIRKKTGLKEGGGNYVFAFMDVNGPQLALCEKA